MTKIALCTHSICVFGIGDTEEEAIHDAWENGVDKTAYEYDINKLKSKIREDIDCHHNVVGKWDFITLTEYDVNEVLHGKCFMKDWDNRQEYET